MSVTFNKNAWKLIPDSYDNHDGSLFGVYDPNDGSSFAIDVANISDEEEYDYDWCESEYFSRLFNIDNSVKEIDRFSLIIDDINMKCVSYLFQNKKFGKQALIRGMAIGETSVIGISMAWPELLELSNTNKVPPKHQIFIDNFELKIDLNA